MKKSHVINYTHLTYVDPSYRDSSYVSSAVFSYIVFLPVGAHFVKAAQRGIRRAVSPRENPFTYPVPFPPV